MRSISEPNDVVLTRCGTDSSASSAYDDDLEPAVLAHAASDALATRAATHTGLVDHDRIGSVWEQAKGTVSIVEMLLAELRTHADPT